MAIYTEVGWKVLCSNRRSVSSHSNKNPLALTYPVGIQVFPKMVGSKLFYFKYRDSAMKFKYQNMVGGLIVSCVALNPTELDDRIPNYPDDILTFWTNRKLVNMWNLISPPSGTWVADSIICLE